MRFSNTLIVLVCAARAVSAQGTGQRPKATPAKVTILGEVRDSVCREALLSPRGNLIACYDGNVGNIRMIDVRTGHSESLVTIGRAGDLAWSPAGDRLAFYRGQAGPTKSEFYIWTVGLDPLTGKETDEPRRVSLTWGSDPFFSPDGRSIAFAALRADAQWTIGIIPAAGGPERFLTSGVFFGSPYTWSPDGEWIYFGTRPSGPKGSEGVARERSHGGSPQTVGSIEGSYLGLSPEGRFILSIGKAVDGVQIADIHDAEGHLLGRASFDQIDGHDRGGGYNVWRPSGPHIFASRTTTPRSLRRVTVATGESQELLSPTDRPEFPSWSDDGRRIVVPLTRGNRNDIAVMNADGSGFTMLKATGRQRSMAFDAPTHPKWSPDGRYVAYERTDGKNILLLVKEISSGRETLLDKAPAALGIMDFAWRPDSRSIRYLYREGKGEWADSARFWFREVLLNGTKKVVRDLGMRPPGGFEFIGDKLTVGHQTGTLEPVEANAPVKLSPAGSRDGWQFTVSPDDRRIAIKHPGGEGSTYDVVSVNGIERATVHLPFATTTRGVPTPDGRGLIVWTNPRGADHARIILAPLNGESPQTIVTLPAGERVLSVSLSRGGADLLYVADRPGVQTFLDIDFSDALKQAAGRGVRR